jgi:uncharacterized protein YjbI with pentapeptide repeats
LAGANLNGANLAGAVLTGAVLDGSPFGYGIVAAQVVVDTALMAFSMLATLV